MHGIIAVPRSKLLHAVSVVQQALEGQLPFSREVQVSSRIPGTPEGPRQSSKASHAGPIQTNAQGQRGGHWADNSDTDRPSTASNPFPSPVFPFPLGLSTACKASSSRPFQWGLRHHCELCRLCNRHAFRHRCHTFLPRSSQTFILTQYRLCPSGDLISAQDSTSVRTIF